MRGYLGRVVAVVVVLTAVGVLAGTAAGTPAVEDCAAGLSEDATAGGDVRVLVHYESDDARTACGGRAIRAVGGEVLGGDGVDIVPIRIARVDAGAIETLAAQPGIAGVERDDGVRMPDLEPDARAGGSTTTAAGTGTAETVPWGIERVNGTAAAEAVGAAAQRNVQVAVLDSGIDLDHPDLDGNLVWGADYIDGNDRTGLQYADDVLDHGTHVAGTIAAEDDGQGVVGMAPNAELYAIRVLNESNFGYYSWWAKGLDAAVKGPDGTIGTADDADVVSMSLGGDVGSSILQQAIENAADHTLIVAAAGNDGQSTNDVDYPGAYPESFTVAATDKDDLVAAFSSEGGAVDIAAPGTMTYSTVPPELRGGSEYAYFQGTSMATPHVSGAAALVIANDLADGSRDVSDAEVRARLRETALDIHGPGEDDKSGAGRLRALAALNVTVSDDPPTAAFSVRPREPIVNETVTFDAGASSDDDGIVAYNWTIAGTRVNATTPTESGSFSSAGEYEVSLTVVDTAGQRDTVTKTVTVEPDSPPTAVLGVSRTDVFLGESTLLDASASSDDRGIEAYNFSVDGGEPTTLTSPTARYTPESAGNHTVTLTVVDTAGQTDTTDRTVRVRPNAAPVANVSVGPAAPVTGERVTLDASASSDDIAVATYNWTVAGQRINSTDPKTGVRFEAPGEYEVALTVVDRYGRTANASATVTVGENAPPTAALSVTPATAYLNQTVRLNASESGDDRGIVAYNWTVAGERTNTTTATLSRSFETSGTYTVSLRVVDTSGVANTTTRTVTVRNETAPTPPVVGSAPPTNVDDDALLEDVDGDGTADVFDAIAYFNNRRSDVFDAYPDRFDFNGNGRAGDVGDVLALYGELAQG